MRANIKNKIANQFNFKRSKSRSSGESGTTPESIFFNQPQYTCDGDRILEDTAHKQQICGKRPLEDITECPEQAGQNTGHINTVNFKSKKMKKTTDQDCLVSKYFANMSSDEQQQKEQVDPEHITIDGSISNQKTASD